jgi:hypothetical protein
MVPLKLIQKLKSYSISSRGVTGDAGIINGIGNTPIQMGFGLKSMKR